MCEEIVHELLRALEKAAERVKHRSLTFSGERREFVAEIEAVIKKAKEALCVKD